MNRMLVSLACYCLAAPGLVFASLPTNDTDDKKASVITDVHYFDFGANESPVGKAFRRITPAHVWDENSTFGWASNDELTAVDFPVDARKFPPPIYTTDIRRDSIQSQRSAVFHLQLSPGRYMVWAMAGTGGGNWGQVWDVTLSSNAQSASATFFGPYAARILSYTASTDDDGLLAIQIDTRSRWSLNALVVAPVEQWRAIHERVVGSVERSITLVPDDVLKHWNYAPPRECSPPLKYNPSELERGFVLYQRPWVTPVWPHSMPYREECDPELDAFMAADEYEPLTFTILPLRDFGSVAVNITSLADGEGNTINASDIDVRYVQYKYGRVNYKVLGEYYRVPDVLRSFDGRQSLVANENFTVWITLRTHLDTRPGIYTGNAQVVLDGKVSMTVPMRVQVLPIRLIKDSSITYSTYYRHPSRFLKEAPDEFSRRWWTTKIDNDMKNMAAHGYNSFRPDISVSVEPSGMVVADLSKMQKQFEHAREYGMDVDRPTMGDLRSCVNSLYKQYVGKPYPLHLFGVEMPPEAFFEKITEVVAATEAERQRRNLPEIMYSLVDEPTATPESVSFTHRLYAAAKKVKSIRTYVTVAPSRKEFIPLYPVIDAWASPRLNDPLIDRQQLATQGIEVWCYPNYVAGENDHTPVAGARMTYGFARWRSGCPYLIPWIFESWGGDPENYLDSLQSDMFNHTSDEADVLSCTLYEAYREGIDDNRYITTLEHMIKLARQAGLHEQADAGQADLDLVWHSIPVQEEYKYETGWRDDSFDAFRLLLAKRIVLLQELLRQSDGDDK